MHLLKRCLLREFKHDRVRSCVQPIDKVYTILIQIHQCSIWVLMLIHFFYFEIFQNAAGQWDYDLSCSIYGHSDYPTSEYGRLYRLYLVLD